MKIRTAMIVAASLLGGTSAFAAKSCDELKTEIAARLDAKSVTGYALDIVAADKAGDGKVVGSCEGGAKKIVYSKK